MSAIYRVNELMQGFLTLGWSSILPEPWLPTDADDDRDDDGFAA